MPLVPPHPPLLSIQHCLPNFLVFSTIFSNCPFPFIGQSSHTPIYIKDSTSSTIPHKFSTCHNCSFITLLFPSRLFFYHLTLPITTVLSPHHHHVTLPVTIVLSLYHHHLTLPVTTVLSLYHHHLTLPVTTVFSLYHHHLKIS